MRTRQRDYVEVENMQCATCSIRVTKIDEALPGGSRSVELILDHDEVRHLFKDFFSSEREPVYATPFEKCLCGKLSVHRWEPGCSVTAVR